MALRSSQIDNDYIMNNIFLNFSELLIEVAQIKFIYAAKLL